VTTHDTKGAEEARNQLPDLLAAAESGRSTVITRHGRPVAAIVPMSQLQPGGRQHSLLLIGGSGKGLWGKSSSGAIRKLRDEWSR
jgi:prevent-host-death family protein